MVRGLCSRFRNAATAAEMWTSCSVCLNKRQWAHKQRGLRACCPADSPLLWSAVYASLLRYHHVSCPFELFNYTEHVKSWSEESSGRDVIDLTHCAWGLLCSREKWFIQHKPTVSNASGVGVIQPILNTLFDRPNVPGWLGFGYKWHKTWATLMWMQNRDA